MKKIRTFWEGVADAFSFSTMMIIMLMLFTLLLAGCSAPRPAFEAQMRQRSDIVAELNRYRASHGLRMVTTNPALGDLAEVRAQNAWPYRNANLADGHKHFDRDVNNSGIPGEWFGENLLAIDGYPTPSDAITLWHTSAGHKAMMQRRSTTECNAAEAFDKKRSVVALICADQYNNERVKW